MKKIILGLLILLESQLVLHSQTPLIQSIINQTNLDSLIYFVKELSGEVQTVIGDTLCVIVSRHKNQPGNDKAADYIKQKLNNYGLATHDQWWSTTCRNVIGVQLGNVYPNKKFIICAHYDDMPSGTMAPGADDNASGVAAVLEAARIFTQYFPKYTIIYALWDEEEQGMVGSEYYAQQAAFAGDSIMGVLNMDMIAWDSDNDNVGEIHIRPIANTFNLKDIMVEVNLNYSIGIDVRAIIPGTSSSDQSSFWYYGYGAILIIEELNGGDFNAYYHTTSDLLTHYNLPYYHKMSRMVLGTVATLAELTDMVPVENELNVFNSYFLQQNFPNPFNPITKIKYSVPQTSRIQIKIFDVLGNEIETLVNEEKSVGTYELTWNAANLSSGVYFYQLRAGSFVETKKMILLK